MDLDKRIKANKIKGISEPLRRALEGMSGEDKTDKEKRALFIKYIRDLSGDRQ
jgi:hypothetical protein